MVCGGGLGVRLWIWLLLSLVFFFFKQKTAYEMRISDWSSDVCSSDLAYMGRSAGNWLAEVERGTPDAARRLMGMERVLGGLEIDVALEDGAWRPDRKSVV